VISELRGVVDETGRSPFWENVGKHFFDTDFRTADLLSGTGRKEFIAKLMTRHPIYIPLLRDPARAAIGRVHPYTKPALSLLRGEGFAFNSEVDVFDAGPTVSALLDDIRIVREIRTGTVGNPDDGIESAVDIIGNSSIAFRACFGPVGENSDGSIALARETMDGLRVKPGDTVSFSPARPRKGKK